MNDVATRHEVLTLEGIRFLFFEPTTTSQSAGGRFWERRHQRTADVDPPTLVVNGRRDVMVPTINSYHLAQPVAFA